MEIGILLKIFHHKAHKGLKSCCGERALARLNLLDREFIHGQAGTNVVKSTIFNRIKYDFCVRGAGYTLINMRCLICLSMTQNRVVINRC